MRIGAHRGLGGADAGADAAVLGAVLNRSATATVMGWVSSRGTLSQFRNYRTRATYYSYTVRLYPGTEYGTLQPYLSKRICYA